MLWVRQLTVFLFIALLRVCPCWGQQDTEFRHNYDLPEMLTRVNSIASDSDETESLNTRQDGLPLFDQYKDLIAQQLLKNLFPDSDKDRCSRDRKYAFQHPLANDGLGLKMLDAFGKPESGILEGNVKWVGNFQECMNIRAPPNENFTAGFKGQYCTLEMSVKLSNMTAPISLGACLPDSCGSVSVENFTNPNPFFNITSKTCQPTSQKLTSAAIAMICVLSLFVIPAVVGSSITVYEYIAKIITQDTRVPYQEQVNGECTGIQIQDAPSSDANVSNGGGNNGWYGTAKEFFNCFCVLTNGGKLLDTSGTEGQLLCLHGIRFLSMTWVIECHVYGFLLNNLGNPKETLYTINTWLFQIILNGFYSVDSFFLLSGFLVAHLYFQECAKKKGKVSWLYFYIHRYVRLTPVYAMVLGVLTTLYYYMGSGPIWTLYEIDPVCQKNWFYNMLYINNFADPSNNCMPWSWYLCNDMQFFIISPILLVTLWRWPKIGYSVLGLFMTVTICVNLGVTYHYKLFTGFGKGNPDISILIRDIQGSLVNFNEYYKLLYEKPYARMSPYLIGIGLAYLLFQRKQNNAGKLNLITLVCGWIIAAVAALSCLFCLYNRKLSLTESAFYNAFSHASFTGALGWVIFTCLNKQAEPVDRILSFKMFIPLSRLTYCAYLIHPLVVGAYFGAMKTALYYSQTKLVVLFLGQLVITYAFAFVVSVICESPLIRLEKLIRTKLMS